MYKIIAISTLLCKLNINKIKIVTQCSVKDVVLIFNELFHNVQYSVVEDQRVNSAQNVCLLLTQPHRMDYYHIVHYLFQMK